MFGRVMRQGARAVGLGFFDRLGGAALGVAEGALAAGLLLFVIGSVLGREPLAGRGLALLRAARARRAARRRAQRRPDVAAPRDARRRQAARRA